MADEVANGNGVGDGPDCKRAKINGNVAEGILLGYGNPLLDISAVGSEEFLKKYDLLQDNAILAEEKHKPIYEELGSFPDVEYVPGGATQNSIRVAQWLLQVPNATTYFGCVSDDRFGKILHEKARGDGVNVHYQYTDKEPTGTCAVILTGDKRSLCANLAAANCFTEDHLDVPSNWNLVEKAEYYYIAGFPLTVCPPAILRIAKQANEKNKTFCMNLSAPFICEFFKEPMLSVLPYVDVLVGNETEAEAFSKANDFKTTDIKKIALKIAAWNKENKRKSRIVIITQGDQPVVVARDGNIKEYSVIPIKGEDIVDTNGAGDAFVGGFLAQLVQGQDVDECVNCGNYAANLIIQRSGCTFPAKPNYASK